MVGEKLHMSIKIIEHKKLKSDELEKICLLKDQHWAHGLSSQMDWINSQFLDEDLHVMKFIDEHLVAYVGINKIKCNIDNKDYEFYGIGNVCVDKSFQGKGYGVEIMEFIGSYLDEEHKKGILLCHKKLCNFYSKVGWNKMNYSEAVINDTSFYEYIMTYNSELEKVHSICIEKNF